MTHTTELARFDAAIQALPLVAILRGLTPAEAPAIGAALVAARWTLIEVPLNSPQPLRSIERLVADCPQAVVGAGTVLRAADVREVHAAGGRLIVAPNFDPAVVRAAVDLGCVCVPGVMTPSEAFGALQCGAAALKIFPAEMVSPAALKAMRAVLDPAVRLLPVGGISPARMADYRVAGASGFGIGSALYRPGDPAASVARAAAEFAAAWAAAAG